MKQILVAIAVVVEAGKILICQRKSEDSFGGYWEFPGGKTEEGESIEHCLLRELREELDLAVEPIEPLTAIVHKYPNVHLTLHPFLCRRVSGEPKLIECQKIEWIAPASLRDFRFPPANGALLDEIVRKLTPASAGAP
jgi:mutator protein MutT